MGPLSEDVSPEAADLVRGLLEKNYTRRFTMPEVLVSRTWHLSLVFSPSRRSCCSPRPLSLAFLRAPAVFVRVVDAFVRAVQAHPWVASWRGPRRSFVARADDSIPKYMGTALLLHRAETMPPVVPKPPKALFGVVQRRFQSLRDVRSPSPPPKPASPRDDIEVVYRSRPTQPSRAGAAASGAGSASRSRASTDDSVVSLEDLRVVDADASFAPEPAAAATPPSRRGRTEGYLYKRGHWFKVRARRDL
jgi:hypothetical protein